MAIIEFIIALVFMCLLISLLSSWAIDYVANLIKFRGKFMKKMLKNLLKLKGSDWADKLYTHPIISSLAKNEKRPTSYIPSKNFAEALTGIILEEGNDESDLDLIDKLKNGIKLMPEGELKTSMKLLLEKSQKNAEKFFTSIEAWFNEYMVRVNYHYKKKLKLPLFLFGLGLALLFNIDAIRVGNELYTDSNLRSVVASEAIIVADSFQLQDSTFNMDYKKWEQYKQDFELPVGWQYECGYLEGLEEEDGFNSWKYIFLKVLGLILTGVIASFGAPFWYDALQKIVGLSKKMKMKTE